MSSNKAAQKSNRLTEYLTHEQEVEYAQAFTLFDRDEDGLINAKELSILIRSLERSPTDHEIQLLINEIVNPESKLIDCQQFLLMMSTLQKNRENDDRRELREIFEAIDTDCNGFIDGEELRTALRLLTSIGDDMKLTKEEVDEMIAEIDLDKDGRLTFDEFASIFIGQI